MRPNGTSAFPARGGAGSHLYESGQSDRNSGLHRKEGSMDGLKLLLVKYVDPDGRETGGSVVAVDSVARARTRWSSSPRAVRRARRSPRTSARAMPSSWRS